MKRSGLFVAIIMSVMFVIPSMASEEQEIIIEEGYSDLVVQEETEVMPSVSQDKDELVIESIEEVPTPGTDADVPSTLAVTYFDESVNIGDSTSFWIYLTANSTITLVSEDDSIATASVTGTSTNVTSSGVSYGRYITINGYKEGTTAININSGSSTIGIINVEVLVETENIGTQHVDSTYTTTVVSIYDQGYSVDTDAVSIKSINTSTRTTTTSVNGNSTTVTTYTSTITLSLNEVGTYDFNIIGSSTGRMKNFKADVVTHIWNDYYTVDVEPTTTSEGSESIHCSVCDEIDPDTVTVLPMKEKTDISELTIELDSTTLTYDGTEKKPGVTIYDGSTKLTSSDYDVAYSNNINAGTATVTIACKGNNYTGETQKTFTIEKANVSNCTITLAETTYVYDGSAKKPSVTVKYKNITLAGGTDYTVSYSNNTNAGEASVQITGKGNYTGTVTKDFIINRANQTVTATVSSSSIVAGKTTTIKASGKGTITYSSSDTPVATVNSSGVVTGQSAGTATITVKAAGNSNYKFGSTTVKITVTASNTGSTSTTLKKGSSYTSGNFVYKILTLPDSGTGTVRIIGPTNKSISSAAIPAKVAIGGRIFKVTEIGTKAFKGCKKLTTVSTGKNVTVIGNQAFQGCTGMTGISIQVSTTTIGKKAFYNCQNLKKIVIKSKQLTSVGKNAFKGIKSNAKIKVPASKLNAYTKLLKGKGQGSRVKITK